MQTSTRHIEVVPRRALAYEPNGNRRGHAHIGFEGYPSNAAGRLDFAPLQLFAHGFMRPGEGFDMHPHEDLYNVLVVRQGRCRHRDSLGGDHILEAGDVVEMSAGRGLEHAEHVYGDETLEALAILVRPNRRGLVPTVSIHRDRNPSQRRWTNLAPGLGSDARVSSITLRAGQYATRWQGPARRAYLAVLGGRGEVDGRPVGNGDRVMVRGSGPLHVRAVDDVDVYLVDMG